jgi:hypothetical protein
MREAHFSYTVIGQKNLKRRGTEKLAKKVQNNQNLMT